MAEYPLFVERNTAIACKIGANARPLADRAMQSRNARNPGKHLVHPSRKGVVEPFDKLKERQIRIGHGAACEQPAAAGIAGKNALEPGKIFGNAIVAEMRGAAPGLGFLVFVIELAADWMVGIVGLAHKVGNRELNLMHPEPLRLIVRSKAKT